MARSGVCVSPSCRRSRRLLVTPFLILLTSSACGVLSLRQEAMDRYLEALEISRMGEWEQPRSPGLDPQPPDRETMLAALQMADQAVAIDPYFTPAHRLAIDLSNWLELGDQTDARFRYHLALFPDDVMLRTTYLIYLREKGEGLHRALTVARDGLNRDPRPISLRMIFASLLAEENERPDEFESLVLGILRGKALTVDQYAYLESLAIRLAEQGHMPEAARVLSSLSEKSSEGLKYGLILAVRQGQGKTAEKLYTYALEHMKPNPPALLPAWIWLLIMAGRLDDAEVHLDDGSLEEAARAMGQPQIVKVLRGWIAAGKGHPHAAIRCFEEVLDEQPDLIGALEGMAQVCLQYPGVLDEERLQRRFQRALEHASDPQIKIMLQDAQRGLMRARQGMARDQEGSPIPPLK